MRTLESADLLLDAADAVMHLRRRAADMSVQAKCMADAMHKHRAALTPEILSEQIMAMTRNQAGLWDAVGTVSEVLDALVSEGHGSLHSSH